MPLLWGWRSHWPTHKALRSAGKLRFRASAKRAGFSYLADHSARFRQAVIYGDYSGRPGPPARKRRGHANTALRSFFAAGLPAQLQPPFGAHANSCASCHNVPIPGGAGDIVANVFVLGQRFDSVTMDQSDAIVTRSALDESGNFVTALNFADSRATPGMFGSGYLELLARDITADLPAIESTIQRGQSAALVVRMI